MEKENSRIHLRLETFSKSEEKAYVILAYVALTYRANLETLSELFKIDVNTLYDKIKSYNYGSDNHIHGLEFLFFGDQCDQIKAAQKVLAFYLAWQKASAIENVEMQKSEKKKLLSYVKSPKGYKALMKLKDGETLTEEEMLLVCKYQIKYGMTYDNLDAILNRDSSAYNQRILRILQKYPSLKTHYDLLIEFNNFRGKAITTDALRKNGGRRS